ncbi:hypothetical protein [Nonomuraea typhae]|uniref:DUF4352 domain-containing protein n=1 Tax=Nonomuraea typhae TaxID=2603600 RepID=A0ABW7Z855_9ACTN
MSSPPLETSPRGRAWMWFAGIAAAILLPLGVAWPLGGLEDAGKNAVPTVAIGQKLTGNRYQFVPKKAAYTTDDPNPSPFGDPRKGRYVVLDLDVTNVGKNPAGLSEMAIRLDIAIDGKPLDKIMSIKDQLIIRPGDNRGKLLNPGMPETVRLSWEVDAETPDPARLTVAIHDEDYHPSWSLLGYASGTSLWYRQEEPRWILDTPLERA